MKYMKHVCTPVQWQIGILRYLGQIKGFDLVVVTPEIVVRERLGDGEDILEKAARKVAQLCEEVMIPYCPHELMFVDSELADAFMRQRTWLDLPVKVHDEVIRLEKIRKHVSTRMTGTVVTWRHHDSFSPGGRKSSDGSGSFPVKD